MKKLISAVLTLGMITSMSIAAFAAETTEPNNKTNLTYGVDSSYSFTIPANASVGTGEKELTAQVKIASSPVIPYNNQITMSINSATNYDTANAGFRMKLDNEDVYLPYTIASTGDTSVGMNEVILNQPAGTADEQTTTLTFSIGDITYAGTYTDQLVFAVAVERIPQE